MLKESNERRMKALGINIGEPKELEIIEGHNPEDYFGFQPARILNYEDTNDPDFVEESEEKEISIGEGYVHNLLMMYLLPEFDASLKENMCRKEVYKSKNMYYQPGFNDCMTHNFFTFGQIESILHHIQYDKFLYNKCVQDFYDKFTNYMTEIVCWSKTNAWDCIVVEGP